MRRLAGVLLTLLLLAACAPPDQPADPVAQPTPALTPDATAEEALPIPTPPPAPVLSVVTTVQPLDDLVRQVGGDRVAMDTLVPPGADSHTYEPRPRDVAKLAEADAFIGVGLGLNDAAVRLADEHLPEGAAVVLLGDTAVDPDLLVHDHAHDHGHSHDHDHGHSHDHAGPGPNPHVWMSVRMAAQLVDGIAEALAALDPEGADTYQERSESFRAELLAFDEAIGRALATIPEGNRTLVTYHDAWSYFARDHGFDLVTAVQPSDFSEPSARDVRAVIDLIREHDVPAVFGSEVFPSDVLAAIADETGATYVGDLADDVLPGEPGDPGHTYVGLMRHNVRRIVEALGGDTSML